VIFNPQHEYTQRLLSDVPRLHEGGAASESSAALLSEPVLDR
jgi:ABC-type dipeptide/oligopeptide/nickel transport system ATPase component